MNQMLCNRCKRVPPEEDKKNCRPCIDRNRESIKKYHDNLRATGICVRCGKEPAGEKWKCEQCRKKDIRDCKEYCKSWREKHVADGLCPQCGKKPPAENKVHCETCSNKFNKSSRILRNKRVEGGLCSACGNPAREGFTRCEKHLKLQKKYADDRKVKLLSEGLCQTCGKQKFIDGQMACETCCLKGVSYSLWKTTSRWEELKSLYDKQGGICPYTGEIIRIGVDSSIDHIIPESKGGTNEIRNLRWIDYWVNVMKWDRTDEELKLKIAKIYSNINKEIRENT